MAPPLTVTVDEIDTAVEILDASIQCVVDNAHRSGAAAH
jgi:4-aminobutyrate aminotransferase-like enzyme